MQIFSAILRSVYLFLSVITTTILVYQILISLFAAGKLKKPVPQNQRMHRFAILISARNEREVIGFLLDSLQDQHYPRELFDLFVIADNCTDNTAAVARAHGATVLERNDTLHKGKGAALDFALDIIHRERPAAYDAFCVFDADNLVDPGFLSAMNRQLQCGVAAAQGYRDIKNPTANWITGSYAIYFFTVFRFYIHARIVLGLSGLLTGTGFMIRADLLKNGFQTHSITEDSEFTVKLAARGEKVRYAPEARFFDEQPETLQASILQRYRWAVGTYQVIRYQLPALLRYLVHGGGLEAIDKLFFLFSVPFSALAVINTGLGMAIFLAGNMYAKDILLAGIISTIISAALIFGQGLLAVVCSGESIKKLWKGVLGWPVFLFMWGYINVVSVFWRDTTWRPIAHKKGVSIQKLRGE